MTGVTPHSAGPVLTIPTMIHLYFSSLKHIRVIEKCLVTLSLIQGVPILMIELSQLISRPFYVRSAWDFNIMSPWHGQMDY